MGEPWSLPERSEKQRVSELMILELTCRYINGLDLDADGTLYVTWCYRDYVDAPRGGKPQQAGPNGPENVGWPCCYGELS
jgi:hypothetical protein